MMLISLSLVALVSLSQGEIVGFTDDTAYFANTDKLQDILEDVGAFTEYINCDVSLDKEGSIGDFETLRRCRVLEVLLQKCLTPCEKPAAMECRSKQIHDLTAEVVYKQCLSLSNDDTDPEKGLYAKDMSAQAAYGGACNDKGWRADACRELLGINCDAPDSECRRYCVEDEATREAYCAKRIKDISATRTLAVRSLKSLIQEKMKSKKSLFQNSKMVRSALASSFHKRALAKDENEELMLLSGLLKDDTIDWEN